MKKGFGLLSPFGLAQIATLLVIGSALWLAYVPWKWGRLKEEVHARFPSVPSISPADLEAWAKMPALQPVLLDARSEAEYHTSYIPGARRSTVSLGALGIEGKFNTPIVVYCAVGFDSAPVAFRYIAQGYTRVQYLEGGIFLWANQGRRLENVRGPTDKVHPGNGRHTGYLDRTLRAAP